MQRLIIMSNLQDSTLKNLLDKHTQPNKPKHAHLFLVKLKILLLIRMQTLFFDKCFIVVTDFAIRTLRRCFPISDCC